MVKAKNGDMIGGGEEKIAMVTKTDDVVDDDVKIDR